VNIDPKDVEEATEAMQEAQAALTRLLRWQAEALIVLAEWDQVWEAAGRPGLGKTKAQGVLDVLRARSAPPESVVERTAEAINQIVDDEDCVDIMLALQSYGDELLRPSWAIPAAKALLDIIEGRQRQNWFPLDHEFLAAAAAYVAARDGAS
jgi:hypothetical protein